MVGAALVAAAWAVDVQRVVLHASFGDVVPTSVTAEVQQAGTLREVTLTDDGTDPADARGDRVWSGTVVGDPAQYLPIRLTVQIGGNREDVYSGVVRAGLERSLEIAFEVARDRDGALSARRKASASPGRLAHATEALPAITAAFWVIFLFAWGAAKRR